MIGTFWNMCRACPSVPVDKLHSEYRSTYRWHEYTGSRHEVIRRPPQAISAGRVQEPDLPRRKKHPELAYKTHEFLSDSASEALLGNSYLHDRARSEERWASSREKNSRRSKSEGPQAGKSSYHLICTRPINTPNRSSTFIKNRDSFFNNENKAPINSAVFSNRNNIKPNDILRSFPSKKNDIQIKQPIPNLSNPRVDEISSEISPKKSILMNGIKNKESDSQETVPVHKKTAELKNKPDQEVLQAIRTNPDNENNTMENPASKFDDTDWEFKSEYKKNFQPFNRYDYDEHKGVFEKRATPITAYNESSDADPSSLSWYKEVVLLRQKANQYRHRGWGTELVPDHIAQLYNDQMLVWEQVSRRSTLSALSLASTVASRNQSPSKEEKENKKNSPMKSLHRAKSAKASHVTGTHQGKSEKKKGQVGKAQAELSPKKGNNQVKKLGIKRTSPNRTSQESGVGGTPTVPKAINQNSEKPKRRPRPTSLIATVPSGSKTAQLKIKEKNVRWRRYPSQCLKEENGEVEDFPVVGDHEQIVKSPPEPTRVKSPEQILIRSPEPVNWTVPLDTGKTFTVTQNIREGDLAPRSYSEARAWTPSNAPPPASISAPTELIELTKVKVHGEILTK